LSTVDIILAVIILSGAYSGYKDGFIVSLFSLFGIILGMLAGFKLMGWTMIILVRNYNVDEKVLPYLAFIIIFIIVVIAVSLLGKFIKSSISKSILGQFDQAIGGLLGLVKVTFMLSIMLWLADSLKVKFPEHWTTNSWLQPFTASFAPKIANWISEVLPLFKDIL
jgi:membrane protein required for colicin V production